MSTGIAAPFAACSLDKAGIDGPCTGTCVDGGVDVEVADATDAPTDAAVDAPPDVNEPCPTARGPKMVLVPVDSGSPFCIDSTEVTNADYALFVNAARADASVLPPMPGACAAKVSHDPRVAPTPADARKPVVTVDWCDAFRYCAWAGKRLCGARTGGPVLPAAPAQSTWSFVCTGGGVHPLPYGDTYAAGACNVATAGLEDAGARVGCEGGFPGVFDMVGNAYEWEDACSGDAGLADTCLLRGGSYLNPVTANCSEALSWGRGNGTIGTIGFRCCAP